MFNLFFSLGWWQGFFIPGWWQMKSLESPYLPSGKGNCKIGWLLFVSRNKWIRERVWRLLLDPFLRDSFLFFLWSWPKETDWSILFCVLSEHQKHYFCLPATLHFCSDSPGWEGGKRQMKNAILTPSDSPVMPWRLKSLCNHYPECCSLSAAGRLASISSHLGLCERFKKKQNKITTNRENRTKKWKINKKGRRKHPTRKQVASSRLDACLRNIGWNAYPCFCD